MVDVGQSKEVADGTELNEGAACGEGTWVGREIIMIGKDPVAVEAEEGAVEVKESHGHRGRFGQFVAQVGVGIGVRIGEGVGKGPSPEGQ